MSLLIKVSVLSCTLSFQKRISPINRICERSLGREVLAIFKFDSEMNHGHIQVLVVYDVSP